MSLQAGLDRHIQPGPQVTRCRYAAADLAEPGLVPVPFDPHRVFGLDANRLRWIHCPGVRRAHLLSSFI